MINLKTAKFKKLKKRRLLRMLMIKNLLIKIPANKLNQIKITPRIRLSEVKLLIKTTTSRISKYYLTHPLKKAKLLIKANRVPLLLMITIREIAPVVRMVLKANHARAIKLENHASQMVLKTNHARAIKLENHASQMVRVVLKVNHVKVIKLENHARVMVLMANHARAIRKANLASPMALTVEKVNHAKAIQLESHASHMDLRANHASPMALKVVEANQTNPMVLKVKEATLPRVMDPKKAEESQETAMVQEVIVILRAVDQRATEEATVFTDLIQRIQIDLRSELINLKLLVLTHVNVVLDPYVQFQDLLFPALVKDAVKELMLSSLQTTVPQQCVIPSLKTTNQVIRLRQDYATHLLIHITMICFRGATIQLQELVSYKRSAWSDLTMTKND